MRVVELGYPHGERTPWASTVRTIQQLLKVKGGLWTFLEIEGIESTNNAALDKVFSVGVRALRQSVIQRKIQSRSPIPPRCHLPQPPSNGQHHNAATGPGDLTVP